MGTSLKTRKEIYNPLVCVWNNCKEVNALDMSLKAICCF